MSQERRARAQNPRIHKGEEASQAYTQSTNQCKLPPWALIPGRARRLLHSRVRVRSWGPASKGRRPGGACANCPPELSSALCRPPTAAATAMTGRIRPCISRANQNALFGLNCVTSARFRGPRHRSRPLRNLRFSAGGSPYQASRGNPQRRGAPGTRVLMVQIRGKDRSHSPFRMHF